jgi:hypothetical protein
MMGWLLRDGCTQNNRTVFFFTPGKDDEAKSRILGYVGDKTTCRLDKVRLDKLYCDNFINFKEWGWTKTRLPSLFWKLNKESQYEFMKGLFSANGYILTTRPILGIKLKYFDIISDIAVWMSSNNIATSASIGKPSDIKWPNGVYTTKKTITLMVHSRFFPWFAQHVGFEQSYKMSTLNQKISKLKNLPVKPKDLKYLQVLNEDPIEVFDFNEPLESYGRANGVAVHNCGYIIADRPVQDYIPMTVVSDELVTGFSPKQVEGAGLVKFDFLGLNTLRDIQASLLLIKNRHGVDIDIFNLPDDSKCWLAFGEGKTSTVFQFDTETVRPYLINTQPSKLLDLCNLTSLCRPGVLDAPESAAPDARFLSEV